MSAEILPLNRARHNSTTLYDKLWDSHIVKHYDAGSCLLYIDRHLVQEVSSPVAFSSLQARGITVRRPQKSLAVVDHVAPTDITANRDDIKEPHAKAQLDALKRNVANTHIPYLPLNDIRQGIAHVVGPEMGFTLPGTTVVCGDSHTATHGAFGALAFGIGSTECEKVFATQCLRQTRAKNMRVTFTGHLPDHVSAKDMALAVIATLGASGGTGYAIEYAGDAIGRLSMEQRMTLCNMTIEAGARVGLIEPDETTYAYIKGRPYAPELDHWQQALAYWNQLRTDPDAVFDREVTIDLHALQPMVTWGTSPEHCIPVNDVIPALTDAADPARRESWRQAMHYMNLNPDTPIAGTRIDRVFIGSCTNSRIEDLRAAATIAKGCNVAPGVSAMVVPGSGQVKAQAEQEGLDQVFIDAGFEWRNAGCSMCVAMNNDRLQPGERCASTSNRNFEGRQGIGGKTHLMSPAMAAAAAINGCITDVREMV